MPWLKYSGVGPLQQLKIHLNDNATVGNLVPILFFSAIHSLSHIPIIVMNHDRNQANARIQNYAVVNLHCSPISTLT